MEVRLDKRYPLAASVEQAWAVLSDVRATAACMPGAQITEQIDDTHYKGTVRSKVGPAVMSFGGDIEVLALDAATRSLQMLGKGADKSGSSAQMNLTAHVEPGETADQSVLVGQATITVSGKLAQFGSRLLVPVSDAMLAQFADNFRTAASAVPAVGVMTAGGEETTVMRMVHGGEQPAPSDDRAAAASARPVAAAPARPATAPAAPAAPAPVKEFNALGLLWTVFKGWFAGLFRRR
jgi:carbon monoxide dehydrogenase subunit G